MIDNPGFVVPGWAPSVARPGDLPTAFLYGTHAQRPAPTGALLGWLYLETDVASGTLFVCTKESTGAYAWTQAAYSVGFFLANTTPPATSTDTGTQGEVRFSSTHFYWCYATNLWLRVAGAAF